MANEGTNVFIDTSLFKGLIDEKDEFHSKAIKLWQQFAKKNSSLVTSNYILDEVFTLVRIKCGAAKVNKLREFLEQSSHVLNIVRVTTDDEGDAWQWFGREDWKLSFTDAVSFAVMRRLEISTVGTFDRDFERAGFKIFSW